MTARAQFSMERTYAASLDEVWALWTTKDGIESWWGPEGFDVTVQALVGSSRVDLQACKLEYSIVSPK